AIARSLKHQELESDCERGLGEIAFLLGELPAARAHFTQSESICRNAGDKRGGAIALWYLGKTDAAAGDSTAARMRLDEAVGAFRSFAMNAEMLDCLEDYGELLRQRGQPEEAVRAYSAAESAREKLLLPRSPLVAATWQARVESARDALTKAAYDAAWTAGQASAIDDAVERLLTLPQEKRALA
ncbi:MAG: hypothetical protein IT518_23565, partial [Burkholderiales bacterium]|nr:hypothetical protein [Burkholderiales bacterium]